MGLLEDWAPLESKQADARTDRGLSELCSRVRLSSAGSGHRMKTPCHLMCSLRNQVGRWETQEAGLEGPLA